MCGRFFLDIDFEEVLKHYFGSMGTTPFDYEPREIFPSNSVPVIHRGKTKDRAIHLMKWGFAPPYMKQLLINARSETIAEKTTFKEAFYRRRCLIPASGYYEWESKIQSDGKTIKEKRTLFVPDTKVISLAGIYDRFFDKEGQPYWAFSILTKPASEDIRHIHDRMPVILTEENEKLWIAQYNGDFTPLFDAIQSSVSAIRIG